VLFVVGTGTARHQQEIVGLIRLINVHVGVNVDAVGRTQCPVFGANGHQLITLCRLQVAIGDGKHLHGPGHVEQEKVGKQHHCYGFHGLHH